MTSLAIRTVDALRREHDSLARAARGLTDDQLSGPSGASEWPVAQVLSHLGSGSEIALATLRAALGEGAAPDHDFNRSVWARWDAMAPADQRDGFIEHNARLVEALEALTPEQHESARVPLGFLPEATIATYAGLRLNEAALHGWDVRVGIDAAAGLLKTSTSVVLEHLSGDLGILLGFVGKADPVAERVVLSLGDSGYAVLIDDSVSMVSGVEGATATLAGPAEAAVRLLAGRLGPEYTPAGVAVTGNVTLAQLREAFPGF